MAGSTLRGKLVLNRKYTDISILKSTDMSLTELKLQIINKVSSITDELILEEIYKLVSIESEMDSIYRLTDTERSAVAEGLKDAKEGRVYSSEAAENMIKEWLEK
jgi:predicted transcriptional regulator